MISRHTKGSKRQLTPTRFAPALAILTAHSPTDTPDSSPPGPMHMVAPTGRLYSRATSIAHSISRILRKYSQMISSILFLTRISRADLSSPWILFLCYSTCNYGASGLGHLFCNITGGLVDLITREFTPFRQRILVA